MIHKDENVEPRDLWKGTQGQHGVSPRQFLHSHTLNPLQRPPSRSVDAGRRKNVPIKPCRLHSQARIQGSSLNILLKFHYFIDND